MAQKNTQRRDTYKRDYTPYQRHDNDTGSPDVQIALLTYEIQELQNHIHNHHKDVDAKRSLLKKVARRKKYLRYLESTEPQRHAHVVKGLKLGKK